MHKLSIILFLFIALAGMRRTLPDNSQQLNMGRFDSLIPKVTDTLTYNTLVSGNNGYALQIRSTYLNDTNYIKNDWPTVQNQVVLAQQLIFKYKDSVLCTRPFRVRKRSFVKFNKKVDLLDAVIFEAAAITGTKGSFYKIRGSGGCTDCSNYTGYYSLKGEILYENYFSDKDKFVKNVGNYKSIWSNYGVQARRANIADINNTIVFPPADNGRTIEGYIY